MPMATVNGESFIGLNFRSFCGVSEKHESFSYQSFALSINKYCSLGLVPQKYYSETPLIRPQYNPESFLIQPDLRFRTTLHSIFTQ